MTLDESSHTGARDEQGVDTDSLTATILTSVERRLTRYSAATTERVDASLAAAQRLRDEVRDDRRALDARLAQLAAHHTVLLQEFDVRLTTVAAQPTRVDPGLLHRIRQSMLNDIWSLLEPVTESVDALADANRRTDDDATALVQHVNTAVSTLVARIDDADERVRAELGARLRESSATVASRLDALEAMCASLAASTAGRDAALADDIAAARDRSEEAVIAATARTSELEERLRSTSVDLATLATKVVGIDLDSIQEMKDQMSATIGEAMLVRIELDRVHSNLNDKLDRNTVRFSAIEALLTDQMDVESAVQLERLDELERAIVLLDPEQFVRRDEIWTSAAPCATDPNRNGADPSPDPQRVHRGLEHRTDDGTPDGTSEAWASAPLVGGR